MTVERSRWHRYSLGAVLALPAALVLMLVVSAITGEQAPDTGAFLIVAGTPFSLIIALTLWRRGRGRIAAAALLVLLAAGAMMLGSAASLTRPSRFFDFVAAVVLPVAAIVALLAAIRPSGEVWRRAGRILGAIAAVVVVVAAVRFVLAGPIELREGDPVRVVTVADRFYPSKFRGRAGEVVVFRVLNEDSYAHTFSVDEFELDRYIGPDADARVEVTLEGSGVLRLYCAINGHEEMVGTIEVRP